MLRPVFDDEKCGRVLSLLRTTTKSAWDGPLKWEGVVRRMEEGKQVGI
jgi:hypothetical protein